MALTTWNAAGAGGALIGVPLTAAIILAIVCPLLRGVERDSQICGLLLVVALCIEAALWWAGARPNSWEEWGADNRLAAMFAAANVLAALAAAWLTVAVVRGRHAERRAAR